MAESAIHTDLVRRLVQWMVTCPEYDESARIFVDLPEVRTENKPRSVLGYFPDLICETKIVGSTYIGEAKIASDIETHHSRAQLAGYLKFLSGVENGRLVLAVPWQCVPQSKSLVRAIQRLHGAQSVQTYWIEQLPG